MPKVKYIDQKQRKVILCNCGDFKFLIDMFNPQRIVVPKQRHNIFQLVTNIILKKSELDGRCYFSGIIKAGAQKV